MWYETERRVKSSNEPKTAKEIFNEKAKAARMVGAKIRSAAVAVKDKASSCSAMCV